MPDNLTPTVATFNAADLASVSAEQRAEFASVLARHGHSKEAVEKSLAIPAAGQTAPGQIAPVQVAGPTDTPPLNNSEMQRAAENLRRHWTGDPAELDAALKAAGVTDKPAAEPPSSDPRDAELARAASAMEPPASASEYDFDFVGIDAPIEAVTEADKLLRQAFKAIEVPKVLGKPLARTLVQASVNRAEGEAGVKIRANEVRATVNNMTGGKWEEVREAANRMLAKMPKEVAVRLLHSDAVADVQVLLMLHRIDGLSAARKAKAGG